jgi:Family of unknown function (DUF5302)
MAANKKVAPQTAADDETKRKFREALEAKKGRQGEAHVDGESTTQHAHGPVETKRTFRRKTG